MELSELRVFLTVASERSFSKAAMKLHRTQPAISQSVRRLEESVGERLFDRATKDATLTEAGRLLRDYADRLLRLSEEAEEAVKDLRDLRRGRVLIGCNEASVHAVLPLIERFRAGHPLVHADVRRIPARQLGAEVAQGSLDFGVLTFQPAETQLGVTRRTAGVAPEIFAVAIAGHAAELRQKHRTSGDRTAHSAHDR